MTEVEILLNFMLIDQFLDILLISLHNLYACQVKREKQDLGYVIYFCQTKIYNFNPICFILKFPKYYYKIALIFFFVHIFVLLYESPPVACTNIVKMAENLPKVTSKMKILKMDKFYRNYFLVKSRFVRMKMNIHGDEMF